MALTKYRTHYIPVPGTILSVIGFIYSLLMMFEAGQNLLCVTSGCNIVRDVKFFGYSPWLASCITFAAIAILCIFRWRVLARFVANFFLIGDCIFLLAMVFIAPCLNCLGVALLIFLTWAALRIDRGILGLSRRIVAGTFSIIWLILFLMNMGHTLNELVPVWALENSEEKIYSKGVFFSPSCPACMDAIAVFSGQAYFYPIAENENDFAIIHELSDRVEAGETLPAAMKFVQERIAAGEPAPAFGFFEEMSVKIKTMRNQVLLQRFGSQSLPTIVFEGIPPSWAHEGIQDAPLNSSGREGAMPENDPQESHNAAVSGNSSQSTETLNPDLPLDFDEPKLCDGESPEPCE